MSCYWEDEYVYPSAKTTQLFIRVDPKTKKEFQEIYYKLKADGLIMTQCDLIRALIEIYRTKKHVLEEVLKIKFH